MSGRARTVLIVLAMVLFASAALAVGSWLSTLHQGEYDYLLGQLVIWTAYAAIACACAGAIVAPFHQTIASRIGVVGLGAVIPTAAFATFPALWCTIMACSDIPARWVVQPAGLTVLILLVFPSYILARLGRL